MKQTPEINAPEITIIENVKKAIKDPSFKENQQKNLVKMKKHLTGKDSSEAVQDTGPVTKDTVSTPEIDMMIIKAGNIEEAMMTKARIIDDMSKKTALDRKTANLTKDRATHAAYRYAQYIYNTEQVAKLLAQLAVNNGEISEDEKDSYQVAIESIYVGLIFDDQNKYHDKLKFIDDEEDTVIEQVFVDHALIQEWEKLLEENQDIFENISDKDRELYLTMTNDCLKDIKNIVIEHPKTEDGKTKKSSDQSISECIQKSADDFMDQIDTSEKTEEQKRATRLAFTMNTVMIMLGKKERELKSTLKEDKKSFYSELFSETQALFKIAEESAKSPEERTSPTKRQDRWLITDKIFEKLNPFSQDPQGKDMTEHEYERNNEKLQIMTHLATDGQTITDQDINKLKQSNPTNFIDILFEKINAIAEAIMNDPSPEGKAKKDKILNQKYQRSKISKLFGKMKNTFAPKRESLAREHLQEHSSKNTEKKASSWDRVTRLLCEKRKDPSNDKQLGIKNQ